MMKLEYYAAKAAAALILCCAMPGYADVLYMNDGQKQVGVIVASKTNNSQVTIRTTSGEITIPRSKVSRTEAQAPALSYGLLGDEYLKRGDYDKAIEAYGTGLQFDAGNVDLQQKIQQARGGVANQDAATQAALDDKARRVVDQAMQLARGGNFDTAFTTLKSIEPSEVSPVRPAYNKALANLYMLWGQNMMDRQNTTGAAEKFNQVLKMEPENARAKELLIKTFAGDPTKLQDRAEFYLQSTVPDEQLQGAEALFKLQQYEKALPIFAAHMGDSDLNTQYNITQRLEFILDTLHQQYASRGDYRQALAYFSQYMQVKPGADATPYSKYLYMIKRAETDMNSANARLELAMFAEQVGLVPTAVEEYRHVLTMDAQSTGALSALRRFAESDLADARDFMAQNQFVLAVEMAEKVTQQYPMYPDITAQSNQIQAMAKVEAQKIAQNKQAEARALAERGDNYYAQAMQYMAAYVSKETDTNVRVFSPRNEAAKYMGQAIFAWKTAVQMDPSLGSPTTYNLYYKIQDASAKYSTLANRRPPPIPRMNRN